MRYERQLDVDPWASDRPERRSLTRHDLVELAARTLMGYAHDHEWTDDDLAPVADGPSLADVHRDLAYWALNATYPCVSTAAELEALALGVIIVSDIGRVLRRYERMGRTARVWGQPDVYAVQIDRYYTSEEITGQVWTVVHRPVAA